MNKSFFRRRAVRAAAALIYALAGGAAFTLLRIPLPWLLGPMVAVFVGSKCLKAVKPVWPGYVRNTGMIVVGYSLGLSFTASTIAEIGKQLPMMILMTVLLLLFCGLIALAVSRIAGVSFPTALTGSIPGGLSQMIALAEETRGIDMTVITFLQVSRLILIILCVPLLIFSPLFGAASGSAAPAPAAASPDWGGLLPDVLPYAAACTLAALVGKRIRFPTAFLLGPMLAAIVLTLSGLHGPPLPSPVLSAAQFMIGGYIGQLLKPEQLKNKTKIILLALASGITLIAGAFGLSLLLAGLHGVSEATAFLSLSPGGMDQMGLIAHAIHADLVTVTCYQLFRTLFIFFAVPPLLRVLFRAMRRKGLFAGNRV